MPIELMETTTALSIVLDEENDLLTRPIHHGDLPVLVAAKVRLAGQVEAHNARLAREDPGWMRVLPAELRVELTETIEGMLRRLTVNANLLERRIALCDEMIGAIAAEARRLSGARSAVYGVRGMMVRSDQAAPISINSRI
jgi:hypothetical protein